MKNIAKLAALAAITSVTAAPLLAGTTEPVVEEEDPFVVAAPVGSSASLGAGTAAGIIGALALAGIIIAASDSDSSSATTSQ